MSEKELLEKRYSHVGNPDEKGNRVVQDRETHLFLHIGPDLEPLYEERFKKATSFKTCRGFPNQFFRSWVETVHGEHFWINTAGAHIT